MQTAGQHRRGLPQRMTGRGVLRVPSEDAPWRRGEYGYGRCGVSPQGQWWRDARRGRGRGLSRTDARPHRQTPERGVPATPVG